MRRGSRIAVAALALAAAGCDLISSLTPFGTEERGPDVSQGLYSGSWQGSTSAAGTVTFNVVSGEVVELVLSHTLPCGIVKEFPFGDALPIDDGAFSGEIDVDPQGRASVAGGFSSRDSVSGSYSFSNLQAVPGCPTSGGGSFTAAKVF